MKNVQYKIAATVSTNALHEALEHMQRLIELLEHIGVEHLRKAGLVEDEEASDFKGAQVFLKDMQRIFKKYHL